MAAVKEPETTTREALEQELEQTRDALNHNIEDREETDRRYRLFVKSGDNVGAAKTKLRLKQLVDEREILQDRMSALVSQWPQIERDEEKNRLPALIETRKSKLAEQTRISTTAPAEFRRVLDDMNHCRRLEQEILSLTGEIRRIAEETGTPMPPLAAVRPMTGNFINEVTKVQTLAGGNVYRQ